MLHHDTNTIVSFIQHIEVQAMAAFFKEPLEEATFRDVDPRLERLLNHRCPARLIHEALSRWPLLSGDFPMRTGDNTLVRKFGPLLRAYVHLLATSSTRDEVHQRVQARPFQTFWQSYDLSVAVLKRKSTLALSVMTKAQRRAEQDRIARERRVEEQRLAREAHLRDQAHFWASLYATVDAASHVTLEHVDQALSHPEFATLNRDGLPVATLVGKKLTVVRVLTLLKANKADTTTVKQALAMREEQARAKQEQQRQQQAREAAIKAQEYAVQKAWNDALIISTNVPAFLGITKAEYVRWKKEGKIPISTTESFRKWGQTLQVAYHHPDDLKSITPEVIAGWRSPKSAARKTAKVAAGLAEADPQRVHLAKAWPAMIAHLQHQGWTLESPAINPFLKKLSLTHARFTRFIGVTLSVGGASQTCQMKHAWSLPLPTTVDVLQGWPNDLECLRQTLDMNEIHATVQVKLDTILTNFGMSWTMPSVLPTSLKIKESAVRIEQLREARRLGKPVASLDEHAWELRCERCRGTIFKALDKVETLQLKAEHLQSAWESLQSKEDLEQSLQDLLDRFDLKNYPASFPLARQTKRRLSLVVGPTNSGKTHTALQALMNAKSGVYLAPLRLLAMEVYDRLTAAGVPCNLITGEEHLLTPGAHHVCATVEMMDAHTPVDVAVIDECQMLDDPDRGSAWTAAIIGVPAQHVFAVGSTNIEHIVRRLSETLDEPLTMTVHKRKTPLSVMAQPVHGVLPGDAVVAFSRREVLEIAERLQVQGLSVATIYGALSPEVRREQAALFSRGDAKVIVATDAIGMGMNLPIRRVLFHAAQKFDGVSVRPLNVSECLQIGGRAGRYGLHEQGEVGAFDRQSLNHLRSMFQHKPPFIHFPVRLPITPTYVQQISRRLHTESLHRILTTFQDLPFSHALFQTHVPEEWKQWAILVDHVTPNLPLLTRFVYVKAPINTDRSDDVAKLSHALLCHDQGQVCALPALPSWLNHLTLSNDEMQKAETLTRHLGLYAWLSFHFPTVFTQGDKVPAQRQKVAAAIGRTLKKLIGLTDEREESYQRERAQRYRNNRSFGFGGYGGYSANRGRYGGGSGSYDDVID